MTIAVHEASKPRPKGPRFSQLAAVKAIRSTNVDRAQCKGATSAGTIKCVALVLTSYADRMCGEAWPSVGRLCRETGYGRTAVQAALRSLESLGWFERRHAGYGGRASATYILRIGQAAAQLGDSRASDRDDSAPPRSRIPSNPEHRAICDAYSAAREKVHGVPLFRLPRREQLGEIAYFVAAQATKHGLPFERMAQLIMRTYLAQKGHDGRLEDACHPLEWLLNGSGPIAKAIAAKLGRVRRAERPEPVAMRVEYAPASAGALDGGGAAAAIAARLAGAA